MAKANLKDKGGNKTIATISIRLLYKIYMEDKINNITYKYYSQCLYARKSITDTILANSSHLFSHMECIHNSPPPCHSNSS